jgi:hypothetical protein
VAVPDKRPGGPTPEQARMLLAFAGHITPVQAWGVMALTPADPMARAWRETAQVSPASLPPMLQAAFSGEAEERLPDQAVLDLWWELRPRAALDLPLDLLAAQHSRDEAAGIAEPYRRGIAPPQWRAGSRLWRISWSLFGAPIARVVGVYARVAGVGSGGGSSGASPADIERRSRVWEIDYERGMDRMNRLGGDAMVRAVTRVAVCLGSPASLLRPALAQQRDVEMVMLRAGLDALADEWGEA